MPHAAHHPKELLQTSRMDAAALQQTAGRAAQLREPHTTKPQERGAGRANTADAKGVFADAPHNRIRDDVCLVPCSTRSRTWESAMSGVLLQRRRLLRLDPRRSDAARTRRQSLPARQRKFRGGWAWS